MIPIRDAIPSKNRPVANYTLIGLNVVLYMVQLSHGAVNDPFIYIYGLVPARYSTPHIADYFTRGQQLWSFISYMFLHGGIWHLLGNIWSLYIFGDNVEDRLGPFRYLAFYLLCGVFSGAAHLMLNFHSNVPTIGASGAIAGVMGAYLILYPRAKILTLWPIIFIPFFFEIPAFIFLGIWFLIQFINAAGAYGDVTGIAWWAHVGGFAGGVLFLKLFLLAPSVGASEKARGALARKKTSKLQVIRPAPTDRDFHLYGDIVITRSEAFAGTRKLVNIPRGFRNRLIRVTSPPGMKEGAMLRLRGLGGWTPDGARGNLFLKVRIQEGRRESDL